MSHVVAEGTVGASFSCRFPSTSPPISVFKLDVIASTAATICFNAHHQKRVQGGSGVLRS